MPLPANYDVDRVFRLAGFPYGRPVEKRPEGYIEDGSNSWNSLVSLFTDDYIDFIVDEIVSKSVDIPLIASTNPVFEHLLAAELLDAVTQAGFTEFGRSFEVTQVNFGDTSQNFESGDVVLTRQTKRVRNLRIKANYLRTQSGDSDEDNTVIKPKFAAFMGGNVLTLNIEDLTVDTENRTIENSTATRLEVGTYLVDVDAISNQSGFLSGGAAKLEIIDSGTDVVLHKFVPDIATANIEFIEVLTVESARDIKFKLTLNTDVNTTVKLTNIRADIISLTGSSSGGSNVPSERLLPVFPGDNNRYLLELDEQTVAWVEEAIVLEDELYEEFSGGQIPVAGQILTIGNVDLENRRIELGVIDSSVTLGRLADAIVARLLPPSLGADGTFLGSDGSAPIWENIPTVPSGAENGQILGFADGLIKWIKIPPPVLANGQVGTTKIADSAVTKAKLASPVISGLLPAFGVKGSILTVQEDDNNIKSVAFLPPASAPTSGGGTITRLRVTSDTNATYVDSNTSPYFQWSFPDGETPAMWQAGLVWARLFISTVSSNPYGVGWINIGPNIFSKDSIESDRLGSNSRYASFGFFNAGGSDVLRLTLNGWGSVPSADRSKFFLDILRLS